MEVFDVIEPPVSNMVLGKVKLTHISDCSIMSSPYGQTFARKPGWMQGDSGH